MNPSELVNDVKEIKSILVDLQKRKEPATADQLKAINDRPIMLDAKLFANHVGQDLKDALSDTERVKVVLDNFIKQIQNETNESVKKIDGSIKHIPNKITITGDIYGFTNFKAALIYGVILFSTFFTSWVICNYYKTQAQETVIYQQAQELMREKNFYYKQIEHYRRNNPRYSKLFPEYLGK